MFSLEAKVAVVTGGASGIGKAVGQLYARAGATVYLLDLQKAPLQEAAQECGAQALVCDVSGGAEVERAIDAVLKQSGRIDIMVNNAALEVRGGFEELTEEDFDRQIAVNLKAPFFFARRLLPLMQEQGGGVFLTTGSVASLIASRNYPVYTMAKHGLAGFTRSIAIDYGKHNIRANCTCPSAMLTPMLQRCFDESGAPQAERQSMLNMQPNGRLGNPQELAYLYLYLASDEAAFVNGAIYTFDGGFTAI